MCEGVSMILYVCPLKKKWQQYVFLSQKGES
jgi:hypothetical protein